ncbi:acetyl-CoA synthetase-like protein [Patellaria atrata CBS 101060]|uniref:Acetyl-CoA synthetase-like protein n=1 Tax=Patellaria atrata CBS 101060 TaxID=1346257 RepID=A0A9P4SCQ0_9PEZI|nr:acetyl-CoA synthetase-like protein [Patellaria atrata CBS 101060]
MTIIVEKGTEGTVYRAAKLLDIPNIDLLTFLFDSDKSDAREDSILHADAANPHNCITKAQARELTKQTAFTLRNSFGIGTFGPNKDVVSAICTGHYLSPILFWGTVAAGGVYSAASTASTPSELARLIRLGESKLLVCTPDTKDVAVAAAKECQFPMDRLVVIDSMSEWRLTSIVSGINSLLDGKMEWTRITDKLELENSLVCLIYSSGTTGLPKGVKISHLNFVAECCIIVDEYKEYNRKYNPNYKYRTVAHLPTAHIAGIQGYFINPFYYGGTVYWMPKFDFLKFLEYCKKFKVTSFFTVPPIYLLIAKSPLVTDQFDTLETAISGAAPLGKDLQHAASKKLGKGKCSISQTWGLSESTGSATFMPHGESDDTGSVSKLIPNTQARIVDENDNDVTPGEPGEIWLKSPVVTNGYYNNPAANAEAFSRDGWFKTGDIGAFRNGLFYILDRKKELIKYKGTQVAPAELEAVLLSHPDIMDAAVIGVEGEGTEVPRAYVVADRKKVNEKKVQEWVKGRTARNKRLRGGVVFVDAIPKSPSGKILRKDLRELARREGRARL